jgi:beta-galactosidase
MNLGVQYYRAPFPDRRYWEDDMQRICDAGLNTVQLWLLWGWIESKPGQYQFDDYDYLIELAQKNGLGVILSTIAEIQPYWIHIEVPNSEMINHLGHKVISQNRGECHFGLTPGGCTDNPAVWDRMASFLSTVATRYRDLPHLRGWDCWNETRWNVGADGIVCYCPHTLKAFRNWLDEKYHGLDGINSTWNRRYGKWDEVLPGKWFGSTYTEMMAFEDFLTAKCNRHGKQRYDLIKALDPKHIVTLHGAHPCTEMAGYEKNTPIDRGNDWVFADNTDGVGCSSFPKWQGVDDANFGMRIDLVKSAAGNKSVWLSELQGGRASQGFDVHKPVDALSQQRWIWNGLASGADTILFWCWRDEVFGSESGGFGLSGLDGLADERIDAMRVTGKIIENHQDVIKNYVPSNAKVGVLFSPQSYYLQYAQVGHAYANSYAFHGYCRALVRKSIPFVAVEEEHLDILDNLTVLFLPRVLVFTQKLEKALENFVNNGGTVVCESETGAFSPQGLYTYPEERLFAKMTGVKEIGRRQLTDQTIAVNLDGLCCKMGLAQWLTPLEKNKGIVYADNIEGSLISCLPVGSGKIIYCSGYLGESYFANKTNGFEDFVAWVVNKSEIQKEIEVIQPLADETSFLYVKHGKSNNLRVVFIFFQENHQFAHLRFSRDFFNNLKLCDILTEKRYSLVEMTDGTTELEIECPDWRFAVLIEC